MEQGARPVERSVRGVINRCSVWRRPRPRLPVGCSRGDRQVFAKKTPSEKPKRPRKRLKAAGSGPVSRPRHSCSLNLHAGTAEHPPGSYDAFGYISANLGSLNGKRQCGTENSKRIVQGEAPMEGLALSSSSSGASSRSGAGL